MAEQKIQDPGKLKQAIIVDVDGTIALRNGRGPFEWDKLETDLPNMPVIEIVSRLSSTGLFVVLVTGREQRFHEETVKWVQQFLHFPFKLYCRNDLDNRSDVIVKEEIYKRHIKDFFDVVAVFDDRERVVQMWRDIIGLMCLQVAPGKF